MGHEESAKCSPLLVLPCVLSATIVCKFQMWAVSSDVLFTEACSWFDIIVFERL